MIQTLLLFYNRKISKFQNQRSNQFRFWLKRQDRVGVTKVKNISAEVEAVQKTDLSRFQSLTTDSTEYWSRRNECKWKPTKNDQKKCGESISLQS